MIPNMKYILALIILFPLYLQKTAAKENNTPKPDTPQQVEDLLLKAINKTTPSIVAVKVGRSNASGVIISADGEILTAAHVATNFKNGKTQITFPDGTIHQAKLLGMAHKPDIALLKIIEAEGKTFPYSPTIPKVPQQGTYCFAYSHPGGLKKNRSAQVRLGRIKARQKDTHGINLIITDSNIQPGDSGGGLFDLSGRLLGLTSTAGDINTNRFSSIEVFHRLAPQLRAGKTIGKAPPRSKEPGKHISINKKTLELGRKELMKRIADKHHPTLIAIRRQSGKNHKISITNNLVAQTMGADIMTLQKTGEISYGMDDPALLTKLPPLPKDAAKRLLLVSGNKKLGYGLPISKNEILTKWSHLPTPKEGTTGIQVRQNQQNIPVKVIAKDTQLDLVILQCNPKSAFNPIRQPQNPSPITAGTVIMARDQYLIKNWGIACSSAGPIQKERYPGAMMHVSKISQHTGPYKSVIRHTLPIFDKDACAPIFNLKGELVAIHIARASRAYGLALPIGAIKDITARIKAK